MTTPVSKSGTFTLGGDLTVHRLGFGAMRIVGKGVWGEPADRETARQVVRRAVELGVDFIDTADSYGPYISEDIIREAVHPYGDVLVATKGGLTRSGPDVWEQVGRPEYLRQCVEMSLRRLGVEQIGLWQLHRIDAQTPVEDTLGAVKELQDAGKIKHIGLSEVSVEEIEKARTIVDVVSVQNLYNLGNRKSEAVLQHCEKEGIGFIPWFPLDAGNLAKQGSVLDEIARDHHATHGQLALAWLLRRSPVMLPIPGTGSVAHLEENCAAAEVELTDAEYDALTAAGQ
ncbi:MAG: NADP-dependent oxidoreductase domain protein [Frankiales bacterium]|nr:NADP-dependent oxidoreductase domain protein [Frankiales bacterium]